MLRIALGVTAALLAVTIGMVFVGTWAWGGRTRALRADLDAAREPVRPTTVDFAELDVLPAPVARYLGTVLANRQGMVSGVRIRHAGQLNMGEGAERWRRFTSDQLVVTRRPGFDWNARVELMPGLPVRVHDAYVAGTGVLHAAVLGLLPVARARDRGAVAEGELMRFLAEATWYPTALLPSQGVRWTPIDARTARATLTDGPLQVALDFTFGPDGLVESVRADARGRLVGAELVAVPWEGRFWNYGARDGMLIPLDGEVAWVLPTRPRPYWRGSIQHITYLRAAPSAR